MTRINKKTSWKNSTKIIDRILKVKKLYESILGGKKIINGKPFI